MKYQLVLSTLAFFLCRSLEAALVVTYGNESAENALFDDPMGEIRVYGNVRLVGDASGDNYLEDRVANTSSAGSLLTPPLANQSRTYSMSWDPVTDTATTTVQDGAGTLHTTSLSVPSLTLNTNSQIAFAVNAISGPSLSFTSSYVVNGSAFSGLGLADSLANLNNPRTIIVFSNFDPNASFSFQATYLVNATLSPGFEANIDMAIIPVPEPSGTLPALSLVGLCLCRRPTRRLTSGLQKQGFRGANDFH